MDLIETRTKAMERVAKWANKSPAEYAASDAQFIAWGSKENPPKGVVRLEDSELVLDANGRQFILGLREVEGIWVPCRFEICSPS